MNNSTVELVGRIVDGKNVVGYRLFNHATGREIIMSKSEIENMALNKRIRNISAQRYGDKVLLKGNGCKITDLPRYNLSGEEKVGSNSNDKKIEKYEIVAKRRNGKEITHYILMDSYGKEMQVDKNNVIKLARQGRITNATAHLNGNKIILRGVGNSLSSLKEVNYE